MPAALDVEVTLPPEPAAFASLLVRAPDGWQVTAPDAATLAGLRAAAGLAADADVIVPLEIRLAGLAGEPLIATKTVALGAHVDNLPVPVILVDGAAPAGAMHAGTEVQLAVAAPSRPTATGGSHRSGTSPA